jgi:hypothetical protein
MTSIMDSVLDNANPELNIFMSELRIQNTKEKMKQVEGPSLNILKQYYIMDLLNAGRTEKALTEIDKLEKYLQTQERTEKIEDLLVKSVEMRALAYFRLGEQKNCIENHNQETCIFPVQGEGIHQDRTGAGMAFQLYSDLLEYDSSNMSSRWLLNLSSMLLGENSPEIPHNLRINLKKQDRIDFPKLLDIAPALGIAENRLSGSPITDDFNGDGILDIVTSSWGTNDSLTYYEQTKEGTFIDRSIDSGLSKIKGGLNIVSADYDNDGDMDFIYPIPWLETTEMEPFQMLPSAADYFLLIRLRRQLGVISTMTEIWTCLSEMNIILREVREKDILNYT